MRKGIDMNKGFNCLECISRYEEGDLVSFKRSQRECQRYLSNQCPHFPEEKMEKTTQYCAQRNPTKSVLFTASVLLCSALFISVIGFQLFESPRHFEGYMEHLGIAPSIVSETMIDTLRQEEKSPQTFLYASRNRHFSAFQQLLEEYLYSFLPYAVEVTPSQAYQLEEQEVIILTGIVTYIQTSSLAETRVWISDGQDRETHSVIWYLNGDEISLSHIGREVRLLTVLERANTQEHLRAREWILV